MAILLGNDIKEQLSIAYVQAVVARAGYTYSIQNLDRESIDMQIHADLSFPMIGLQLKATAHPHWVGDELAFSLSRKNYTDLSALNRVNPAYLVILVLPARQEDWCCISPDKLVLKECVYWLSLKDFPEIDENQDTKTVHLPKANLFSDATLKMWFADAQSAIVRP